MSQTTEQLPTIKERQEALRRVLTEVQNFRQELDEEMKEMGWTQVETKSDYIHGKPYRDGQSYFRRDTYIPTGNIDRLFVASMTDDSPMYRHWQPGNYNSECSCCYLGFAHSEERHNQSIA